MTKHDPAPGAEKTWSVVRHLLGSDRDERAAAQGQLARVYALGRGEVSLGLCR